MGGEVCPTRGDALPLNGWFLSCGLLRSLEGEAHIDAFHTFVHTLKDSLYGCCIGQVDVASYGQCSEVHIGKVVDERIGRHIHVQLAIVLVLEHVHIHITVIA